MATPFLQLQSTPINITPGSPGSVLLLTKDATGAAVNVSSGYALDSFNAAPTNNRNPDAGAVSLASLTSQSFGTTGVTVSWTSAQATSINDAMAVLGNQYALGVSNDTGTTRTILAVGSLNINNAGGLL